MQRGWVVGGGGLHWYLWEQEPPVGVQMCSEEFRRPCIGDLSQKFKKCDSMNAESVLTTAGIIYPLVVHVGVATKPCVGWMGDDGLHGAFQNKIGDHEHGY